MGAFDSCVAGLLNRLCGGPPFQQDFFDLWEAPWNGGDAAEDDAGMCYLCVLPRQNDCDADQGEVGGAAFGGFEVEAGGAGGRGREMNPGEDFVWSESGFAGEIFLRTDEEVGQGQLATPSWADYLHPSAEGDQSGGSVRGMDDEAAVTAEDGVIAVPAADGEAAFSPLADAGEVGVTVVPATGPLAEVAADGAGVADLWGGGLCDGLDENRVIFDDQLIFGDITQAGDRADGQAVVWCLVDAGQFGDRFQVDQVVGCFDAAAS